MGFDSIYFISCFLPVALGLYWLIPGNRGKNAALLLIGLIFYAFGSISALALLLLAAFGNYLLGLLLKKQLCPKGVLIAGVTANLVYLGAFKYLHFLLSDILGISVGLGLAAPLGMSFFLFKAISYLVDTYREPQVGTKRFDHFLLYLSFFPQVTAGPITRFDAFSEQLTHRSVSLPMAAAGIRRFLTGMGKKVLLCGTISTVADGVFAMETGLSDARLAWLGAISYMLQIYLDFSGYSDMAIGLGQAMGFETPENFRYPYTASSVGDFWHRWHISLSTWFKDYLYIPLGGNRRGKGRAALNKIIVFALCGLWHGAAWTFLVWGLWHGLFSALESLGIIPVKKANQSKPGAVLSHIYVLLVVCLGFVMFRAESLMQGFTMIAAMFTGFSFGDAATVTLYRLLNWEAVTMLVLGAGACLPVKQWLHRYPRIWKIAEPLSYGGCLMVFLLCVMKLAAGGFAPFIYGKF